MIAGQGKDGAAAQQERLKGALQVLDRVTQVVGSAQLAEQVARDEQHLNGVLGAQMRDALDGALQIGGSVLSAQTVAQMPVGSVEDFHITYYLVQVASGRGQQDRKRRSCNPRP